MDGTRIAQAKNQVRFLPIDAFDQLRKVCNSRRPKRTPQHNVRVIDQRLINAPAPKLFAQCDLDIQRVGQRHRGIGMPSRAANSLDIARFIPHVFLGHDTLHIRHDQEGRAQSLLFAPRARDVVEHGLVQPVAFVDNLVNHGQRNQHHEPQNGHQDHAQRDGIEKGS